MSFDHAFDVTVGVEGGYSNNPNDSGGETMYGITVAVARANGYTGAMLYMPVDVAKRIYRSQYWDLLRLDPVDLSSPEVALELFDTGVNCGVGVAARMFQRALNVLNREGRDYPDGVVDGVIGPVTVSNFRNLLAVRGDQGITVMLRVLNGLQCARYVELCEQREKDEDFMAGWVLARVHI